MRFASRCRRSWGSDTLPRVWFRKKQRPQPVLTEPTPLTEKQLTDADTTLEKLLAALDGLKLLDQERKDGLRAKAERMIFDEATRTINHAIRP